MVRNIKEVLKELGWTSGFNIPVANEENKKLEKEIEDKLKRKAEIIVELELTNDRLSSMNKHLMSICNEKERNQELISVLKRDLETQLTRLRLTEAQISKTAQDTRIKNKEIDKIDERDEVVKDELKRLVNKFEKLKELMEWGEEELLAWEEVLTKGELDIGLLERYKLEDQERFEEMEIKRKALTEDFIAVKALEQKEVDRCLALEFQLEQTCKLFREMHAERARIIGKWHTTINNLQHREKSINEITQEIDELRNCGRTAYVELCDKRKFYDAQKLANSNIEKHIFVIKEETTKSKSDINEIGKIIDELKSQVSVSQRALSELGVRVASLRSKNSELAANIAATKEKENSIKNELSDIRVKLDLLNAESVSSEQAVKNAEEIYELGRKTKLVGARELDRMQSIIFKLKQDIALLKEKQDQLKKQIDSIKHDEEALDENIQAMEAETENEDQKIYDLEVELESVEMQILQLSAKTIDTETIEKLEKQVSEMEHKVKEANKEYTTVQAQLLTSKNELNDVTLAIKQGINELGVMESKTKELKLAIAAAVKGVSQAQNDFNQSLLQLSLVKMQVDCTQTSISKEENFVCLLERQQIELEANMKEKNLAIETQKQILMGKKKILIEERSSLKRSIDHLNVRIKQLQAKYDITMDMLGKDEDGQQLTVTYFKIKSNQEKHELQEIGDELEAKINKCETEIRAMENTLQLVSATNENFKRSMKMVDEDSPEMEELNLLEKNYLLELEEIKDKNIQLKQVRLDVKSIETKLEELDKMCEKIKEEWKVKDNEALELDKDLSSKQAKLDRATKCLSKLMRDTKSTKETLFRQLAHRDIDIQLKIEINQSVLQQLAELAANYIETGPLITKYLEEHGLSLPPVKTSSLTQSPSHTSISSLSIYTCKSITSSESHQTSVINMDPHMIPELHQGAVSAGPSKRKDGKGKK